MRPDRARRFLPSAYAQAMKNYFAGYWQLRFVEFNQAVNRKRGEGQGKISVSISSLNGRAAPQGERYFSFTLFFWLIFALFMSIILYRLLL